MRSGGAVRDAAIAGLMFAIAGCGPQNPSPKAADPAPSPALPPNANNAGAPGAAGSHPQTHPGAETRDPSKLLESYDAGGSAESALPAKPSNSGLGLEVRERGPGEHWVLFITNHGDQPAELVADMRLLWFNVTLPGKKKQSLCKLPEPLSTGNQPEARLIVHLEPGEGVADRFDPRLYCFAEGDQKLLVAGAEVTPHFGWSEAPPRKRWKRGKLVAEPALQKPPFVARQSLETERGTEQMAFAPSPRQASPRAAARLTSAGVTGADKQLEGAQLTLRSEYAVWSHQEPQSLVAAESVSDPPPPPIALRLVQGSDARAEHDATVELTLSNEGPLPSYVYFRREMVSFEIAGPSGITRCPGRLDDRTPERSAFLHLTRKARRSFTARLAELCPRGTFAIPGLYLAYARFDATLSGHEQGIEAFVGPVYSQKPATVRIRTGEEAIFRKRPMTRISAPPSTGVTREGAP